VVNPASKVALAFLPDRGFDAATQTLDMRIMLRQTAFAAGLACMLPLSATLVHAADVLPSKGELTEPAPRLILQITVDQLRGDLPGRYLKHMGEGGYRYLMDHGVWFADAHHGHANTETIVGHATLATGADPAAHGMIGNVWLDRLTGTLTYNIEDPKYRILTAGADVNKATEIDPTQKVASTEGRSPNAILVSTFGDELAIHTAGRAKIFGVSVKDRGAVSMAGHAGKAFWFSKASGEFVTSSYYYDHNPAWVDAFNRRKLPAAYDGKSWELMHDKSAYLFGDADDKPWETDLGGYGRLFPHPYGPASGKYFTTRLTLSPAGDDLTLSFAKALFDAEQIGQDEVTDYLSVSFSSTDYVGHLFGPSSLEAEDNQLRLDRTLAELFAYVDRRVGLANVVIVLSADHGGPEAPGQLNSLGIPARYVSPEQWDQAPGISALKRRFGVGKELIEAYRHPYVYLNREIIREKGLDSSAVEKAVVEELLKLDGVALAISSSALRDGNLPETPLVRSVLRNFNPRRSGDIFVVFEPHCFINDFDGLTVACTHGAPWRYDTFVPVVFAGGKLTGRRIYRPIETVNVAPTLAAIVGTKPPSGSRSAPLPEVLQGLAR
jgi:predicted AlkP superfamily pyrophosphatase or phosphodiesterase